MEHLRKFIEHYKEANPEVRFPKATDQVFEHMEKELLPHVLKIMQKDNTLFTAAEQPLFVLPDIDFRPLWKSTDNEWMLLHKAMIYAVLHGDPKEKFGTIIETIKGILPGGSSQADEVMKILEDEETQGSLQEILDIVMNTRLASLIGDLVQSLNIGGLPVNFENPDEILNMLKNPKESPIVADLMERTQMILEEKIKTGKINQQELVREIEMIRAKLQSAFGKYLNEALIGTPGNTTGNTAQMIMSNHPDARRARMMARLQKKQREKLRH